MSGAPTSSLRIADVAFNREARTLDAAGRQTLLDNRSCNIFVALAENLGTPVDKERLLRVAWPDQIVHENSLAKAISRLRQALASSQLEIVASYGVGYALRERKGKVCGPEEPPVADAAPHLSATPRRLRSGPIGASLMLLVIAIVGLLALSLGKPAIAVRETPPITHDAPDARATILWIDDHPANNRLEIALFKERRLAVHLAQNTEDALKLLAVNHYDLVLSDLGRGEDRLAGLKMTQEMKQRGMKVPVIIYTVRPKDPSGQVAQRRLVTDAGAADLAVTPTEVRTKVLERLAPSA
jgi:DNA-binding response OmpR family regulator